MCESVSFDSGAESSCDAGSSYSNFETSESEAIGDNSDEASDYDIESDDIGASSDSYGESEDYENMDIGESAESYGESERVEDDDVGNESISKENTYVSEENEALSEEQENFVSDNEEENQDISDKDDSNEEDYSENDKENALEADPQKNTENYDFSETEENFEVDEKIRKEINERSEYSKEVNDHIHSVEELEVYKNAGLKEEIIDGRTCLVRSDVDLEYMGGNGEKTNRELMKLGRAPYDAKTGETIELHHIGQDYDSPLAEVTENTEHGNGNHKVLHEKTHDSWRNDPHKRNHYNGTQRPNHWKARVSSM